MRPKTVSDLRKAAMNIRERAYAPYSNFKVGAALRAASGKIYVGVNVENVSYPVGTCAEESAISALIAAGETEILEAYVVADSPTPVPPCGACRQRLKEFAKPDAVIWMGTVSGQEEAKTVGDFLPGAFDPKHMAKS